MCSMPSACPSSWPSTGAWGAASSSNMFRGGRCSVEARNATGPVIRTTVIFMCGVPHPSGART